MSKQYVSFKVMNAFYCVDIMDVQEVIRENVITVMPNFPPFIEGVVNLRGKIIPIVCMQKRLFSECETHDKSVKHYKIIVVQVDDLTIGLKVHSVDKILNLENSDLECTAYIGQDEQMLSGVLSVDGEVYSMLHVRNILKNQETLLLQAIK